MKEFTLKTINDKGELVSESNIKLDSSKDILIMRLPLGVTDESANMTHNYMAKSLESNSQLITLHHGIELLVLEIE